VLNISLSKTNLASYYHKCTAHRSSCKVTLGSVWKYTEYQNSRKSVQLGQSCSMQTDRPLDMTKRTVAFGNVANALKKRIS